MFFETRNHRFGLKDTIRGAIRLYNNKDLTKEELDGLCEIFNELNNSAIPKPGDTFIIPVKY